MRLSFIKLRLVLQVAFIYFQKNHYTHTYFVLNFVVKICYNKANIIKRSQTNEKQRNYRIGSGNTYQ